MTTHQESSFIIRSNSLPNSIQSGALHFREIQRMGELGKQWKEVIYK